MSSRFFKWRIRVWEQYLADIKKQKIAKLNDLKEIMDFNKNFRLLLTYSRNLESKEKIALFEGIDLHLLLQQQEDIKRYLNEMEAQKRKEIEKQRMKEEYERRLEYEQRKKQLRLQREEQEREMRARMALASPPKTSSAPAVMPTSPRGVMSPPPPARVYPTYKPNISRATVEGNASINAKVTRWDKILDFFMGGEDYQVSCGNCGAPYRTMTQGDSESVEFVCGRCGGINSTEKPPTAASSSSLASSQEFLKSPSAPKLTSFENSNAKEDKPNNDEKEEESSEGNENNKETEKSLKESEDEDENVNVRTSKRKGKEKESSKLVTSHSAESLDELSKSESRESKDSKEGMSLRNRRASRGTKTSEEKKDKPSHKDKKTE